MHAGWLRDPETWPPGAVTPDPDDVQDEQPTFQPFAGPSAEYSSSATTPQWTAINRTVEDGVEGTAGRQASGMVGVADF